MEKGRMLAVLIVLLLLASGCSRIGTSDSVLSPDQAKKLVLERVEGASLADFWEFDREKEKGGTVYEGTLIFNSMEYEFEIDGNSGAFRQWKVERAERLDDK